MAETIIVIFCVGATLAWICFLSFVVARFAWRDLRPVRRAAATAATSFIIACLLCLLLQFLNSTSPLLTALGLNRFSIEPYLYYAAAAFVDFLLMRRHFLKAWVDEPEFADSAY